MTKEGYYRKQNYCTVQEVNRSHAINTSTFAALC